MSHEYLKRREQHTIVAVNLNDVLVYGSAVLRWLPGYLDFPGTYPLESNFRWGWNVEPKLVDENVIGSLKDKPSPVKDPES